ncbi:hypothetical protein ETAA8_13060 [Anatilimnocola aggregata]|uniref:Uncharacterized protein n=1 Tax=Anatilimnocola aggregata TaxID=2528021 RepID=A0A517Y7L5_9BACT|nr:hypothetical protein [Anatilimnocola aggregata]QDU26230.1 hypothetical protein ETAA8_13060 [Anatilimnocola aggregata]
MADEEGLDLADIGKYGSNKIDDIEKDAKSIEKFLKLLQNHEVDTSKHKGLIDRMGKRFAASKYGQAAIKKAGGALKSLLGTAGKVAKPENLKALGWLAIFVTAGTVTHATATEGPVAGLAAASGVDQALLRGLANGELRINPAYCKSSLMGPVTLQNGDVIQQGYLSKIRNKDGFIIGYSTILGVYATSEEGVYDVTIATGDTLGQRTFSGVGKGRQFVKELTPEYLSGQKLPGFGKP